MSRPNQFLSPEGDIEDYFVDEYWLIDQYVGDTLWTWGVGSFVALLIEVLKEQQEQINNIKSELNSII